MKNSQKRSFSKVICPEQYNENPKRLLAEPLVMNNKKKYFSIASKARKSTKFTIFEKLWQFKTTKCIMAKP